MTPAEVRGESAQPNIKELMTVLNALEQGSDEWYSVFEIINRVRKTTYSATASGIDSGVCVIDEQAQPAKRGTLMSQPDSSLSGIRTVAQPGKKSSSSPHLRKCENRKSIKLTEFDGTTPWPMFSQMFENCSKFNGWDESERLIHLQLALHGAAQQMMWTDGRANWTSTELLAELAERFSPESQADQYRALLSTRRRHKGESISDLGQDIQRLAALAFPGPRDQTKEMFAIDAFLRAVSNKDMGFHMKRTASVKTLTEAIRYAQQYEAFHCDSDDDEPMYNMVRKEKKTKIAATAGDKEVRSTRVAELEETVRQLTEQLEVQQLEHERRLEEIATRDRQQFSRNRDSPRRRGQSLHRYNNNDMNNVSILCFHCGGPGHYSRNCWKRQQHSSGTTGGFQNDHGATGNWYSGSGNNLSDYGATGDESCEENNIVRICVIAERPRARNSSLPTHSEKHLKKELGHLLNMTSSRLSGNGATNNIRSSSTAKEKVNSGITAAEAMTSAFEVSRRKAQPKPKPVSMPVLFLSHSASRDNCRRCGRFLEQGRRINCVKNLGLCFRCRLCFRCGLPGHIARKCSVLRRNWADLNNPRSQRFRERGGDGLGGSGRYWVVEKVERGNNNRTGRKGRVRRAARPGRLGLMQCL